MKGKINVRFYSLNKNKLKKSILHNFRIRKDLFNVNYSRSEENIYSHSPDEFKTIIEEAEHEHNQLCKNRTGRNLQKYRVNSIVEGVITFPRIYQTHYENGKFTKEQLLECFEEFKTIYERESNVTIKGFALHLSDESVFHFHWWATNYETKGERIGRHFNPKGWKSYSQQIGGESFKSIGLQRGTPKSHTRAKHTRAQEHYEQILDQSAKLEELLEEGLSIEEVGQLIKMTEKPLKTMLVYTHRAMQEGKEGKYIAKQQKRAMTKFQELFPNIETVSNFEDLLDYISETQKNFKTQNHKPRK